MFKIKADSLGVHIAIGILGGILVVLSIIYLFYLKAMIAEAYIYLILGLSLPILALTRRADGSTKGDIPWWDILMAIIGGGVCLYCSINALEISLMGWEFTAPAPALISGLALLMILLELTRRSYGYTIFFLVLFFMFEPMFASLMLGPFKGLDFSFDRVMSFHLFSRDSLIGTVGEICGKLLIGYMLFAGFLQVGGGGKFFLDLGLCFFGKTRGAPAKVAVFSSGIFGMFCGAPVPNILTTGAFTIPAMMKIGYKPHYAAGVEACAATGGAVMPPVMGTAAFIIAGFLGINYWTICVASVLPAVLYYWVLFVQADSYAGRKGLGGMTGTELPKLGPTLKNGAPFFVSLFVLIWFLAVERREAQAPFYTVLTLVAASFIQKKTRPNLKMIWQMFENSFKLMGDLFVLLYALGMTAGALTLTGILPTLSYGLVHLVGEWRSFLPIMAMIIGYILGMGVPGIAVYVVLATSVAPALVLAGFDPLATQLLCLYVGYLTTIIPPVAIGAITAGKLAGESRVMLLGFTAMRLGMGLFIVPILFIFNPALMIGKVSTLITLSYFLVAVVGFALIGGGFEGYLWRWRMRTWQAILISTIGIALVIAPMVLGQVKF